MSSPKTRWQSWSNNVLYYNLKLENYLYDTAKSGPKWKPFLHSEKEYNLRDPWRSTWLLMNLLFYQKSQRVPWWMLSNLMSDNGPWLIRKSRLTNAGMPASLQPSIISLFPWKLEVIKTTSAPHETYTSLINFIVSGRPPKRHKWVLTFRDSLIQKLNTSFSWIPQRDAFWA